MFIRSRIKNLKSNKSVRYSVLTVTIIRGGDRMNNLTTAVSIIGIIGTISSVFFAYLAFKRNDKSEIKIQGKSEGTIMSDIVHIKDCVDRLEKNLNKVDERYRNILERLVKVEESVSNIKKYLYK